MEYPYFDKELCCIMFRADTALYTNEPVYLVRAEINGSRVADGDYLTNDPDLAEWFPDADVSDLDKHVEEIDMGDISFDGSWRYQGQLLSPSGNGIDIIPS